MKNRGSLTTIAVLFVLLISWTNALAATDGIYQLSEVTATWDGTDAGRTKAPSADYDYTYGDEGSVTYSLPWSFGLYGQNYAQIVVDVNGFIRFAAPTAGHSFNLTATGMGPVVAPWNNDLSSYYYGGVFIQHKTNPERVVVQWQTETYTEEGFGRSNDVEAVLFPDGTIRFDYQAFATQAGKDFGSGISRGDGTAALNLTAAYGNVYTLAGRSFQFVDATPPALTVTASNALVNKPTVTLSGTMSPGCDISVSSATAATLGTVTYLTATSWTVTATNLTDGANTFTVTATRQRYAVSTTATKTVTLDRSIPSVVINGPAGYVRSAAPALDYTVIDGVVTDVKVDNVSTVARTGQNLSLLAEGPHTLAVAFTDGSGPGSVQSAFIVDTVPPALTIDAVASPLTTSTVQLSGTVESGLPVTVAASTSAGVGTVTTTGGAWSCSVANLPAGNTTFTVTTVDPAGNGMLRTLTVNYVPALLTTVTPAAMAADQTGDVRLIITNIPTPAAAVLVEQYIDANRNSVFDTGDYVVRSFSVTDGAASADPGVPGDTDASANGTIAVTLPAAMTRDLYHAPGTYLFRISQTGASYTVPFAVTPLSQSQGVSGLVSDGNSPIPGALIRLADNDDRHLGFGVADQSGQFTLDIAVPGTYRLTPLAYGYLSPAAATVNVTSGYAQQNLTLTPGTFHLTGRILDDTTTAGLGGIWIKATGVNGTAVAMSAADGGYDLALPTGQYDVLVSSDPAEPNPAAAGYVTFGAVQFPVALSADSGGHDILLPRAVARASGRVVDTSGNGIPGVAVQALVGNDTRLPQSIRTSDANGDFTVPLTAGSAWSIALKEPYASLMGLLGASIGAYSVGTSPATGNDIIAHAVTAWVQGVVKDSANTLQSGMEVVLRHTTDASVGTSVVTKQDGSYRIGAYDGNWSVQPLSTAKGLPAVAAQTVTLAAGQTLTLPDFVVDVTPPTLTINAVTSPTEASSQTLGGTMEAGATITISVNTAAQAGTVTYPTATTWSCDLSGLVEGANAIAVTATDSSGNRTTQNASITYSRSVFPDLVITSISAPASAITGTPATVTVTVKNQGNVSAGYFNVGLYLSSDGTITSGDTYVYQMYVNSLGAGGQTTLSFDITVPSMPAGNYYFGAIADCTTERPESDETNNTLAAPAPTAISPGYPDLVVTAVSAPASAIAGTPATVTVTIKNQGAVVAGYFYVSLYLSTDATITETDTNVYYRWYVNSLGAGSQTTLSFDITVPSVPTGSYYFGAIADCTNERLESDETNNNLAAAAPTAISPGYPDLVVTAVSAPASASTGESVTIPVTVRNLGVVNVGSFYVGLYLSTDGTITSGDTYVYQGYVNSLMSWGQTTLNFNVTVPSVPTGSYYFGAIADWSNNIAESDKTNNNLAAAAPTAISPGYPDLLVTAIGAPASTTTGASVTIPVTIRNLGITTAYGFYVGLYLSPDGGITNSDTFVAQQYVSWLGSWSQRTLNFNVPVPSVAAGTYYFGAIADNRGEVAESDKTNNSLAGSPTVVGN